MDFFPVLKCVAANHVWRDYNTEQNVLQVLFLYYFADILFFLCVLELLELGARFALHMPGKNYIMEKWTKKSESTNT